MKIGLLNFTQSDTTTGGCETRHGLLRKALTEGGHDCVLLATEALSFEALRKEVDEVDVLVMDSAVGYTAECPTITIFGNAWRGVICALGGKNEQVEKVIAREQRWHIANKSTRVAVSNYIANAEMYKSGIFYHEIISNPADFARFDGPRNRKRRRNAVLWVGPDIPVKGADLFRKVRDTMPGVEWIVHNRNDASRVDRQTMDAEIKRASVVLCTSVAEGCSNTLMEAIAADVPIVTSRSGLFWDFWDTRLGLRCETRDPDEYTSAITAVLNSNEWEPRQAAIHNGWDYTTWAKKWQTLVETVT